MKTDALIEMLARGAGAAPRALTARRLGLATGAGAALALLLALGVLGPMAPALWGDAGPWIKLGYALTLALGAGVWTARLGRPGAATAGPARFTAAVVLAMAAIGGATLLATPPGERLSALLGESWAVCPLIVFGLSLPTLALTLWALRGLAPTRPRQAGAVAGLLAGAIGAFGYAFACDELAPSFVAVWYSAGIALAGALGAWLGPRWLRW